jgi:hypothetical protein
LYRVVAKLSGIRGGLCLMVWFHTAVAIDIVWYVCNFLGSPGVIKGV